MANRSNATRSAGKNGNEQAILPKDRGSCHAVSAGLKVKATDGCVRGGRTKG